ncbi:MAG: DUF615 domain-containing protein [Rhodocyclaceae bacterium]|nr:DUF615 domain-containing protein [Rhodocyclaceae bacterium]
MGEHEKSQGYNHTVSELDERPSKSARKRAMHALQALGEALVDLPEAVLARLELPEALAQAVHDARRFRAREARRRQLQYIGRLMRTLDAEAIAAALDEARGASAYSIARHQSVERLRERLLADEKVIDEIAARQPRIERAKLLRLRREALLERAQAKPPRAYRALFRLLMEHADG